MELKDAIDRLGFIEDELQQLQDEKAELREVVKEAGVAGQVRGHLASVVVAHEKRRHVAWKAVAQEMEPPKKLVDKHTNVSTVMYLRGWTMDDPLA